MIWLRLHGITPDRRYLPDLSPVCLNPVRLTPVRLTPVRPVLSRSRGRPCSGAPVQDHPGFHRAWQPPRASPFWDHRQNLGCERPGQGIGDRGSGPTVRMRLLKSGVFCMCFCGFYPAKIADNQRRPRAIKPRLSLLHMPARRSAQRGRARLPHSREPTENRSHQIPSHPAKRPLGFAQDGCAAPRPV